MNVVVERLPESKVLLDISTDEQEFEKALQRAYRKVVNQVRLPGFRPGKAPRMIIEKMLGREILIEQADRDLLDPLYQQALEREELTPVGEPEVEIYQAEPLAFKITVQVYPTVDPGEYQGVRIEPRRVEIGDEQIDEALERLRASRSPWQEPAEPRPAREGDRVTLDVTIHEQGSAEPYREPLTDTVYVLGQDGLFPQLRDAIIGMNVGDEKSVEIAFDEDDQTVDEGMRAKTMVYGLTLKKIEEQQLLPLDDDFAATVSEGKITTLDDLREDVRQDLLRTERQKARNELGGEVVSQIGERANIELPAVMVDKQVDSEIENLRNHLAQDHGQTLETHLRLEGKTEEELREELRPEAIRRLRNSLVLREIATREGVSVSPQDIDAEIERMIDLSEDKERMRQIYSGNYIRNLLENELFDRKLIDRVIEIATEGRGPYEPREEEPAAAEAGAADQDETAPATEDEQGPVATAPEAVEGAGILPADREVTINDAEATARAETRVPEADQPESPPSAGDGTE